MEKDMELVMRTLEMERVLIIETERLLDLAAIEIMELKEAAPTVPRQELANRRIELTEKIAAWRAEGVPDEHGLADNAVAFQGQLSARLSQLKFVAALTGEPAEVVSFAQDVLGTVGPWPP